MGWASAAYLLQVFSICACIDLRLLPRSIIFITCAFEHSVANMCGLMLGLLLPHEGFAGITWGGYVYNVSIATLGNIVGGVVLVAGLYWVGSPAPQPPAEPADDAADALGGLEQRPAVA